MGYSFPLWRDKLLLLSLLATFNAGSSYLRVLIRALLEGRAFEWSYSTGVTADGRPALIRGEGLNGDVEPLLLGAGVVLWLLCVGCRRPDRLFSTALAGWITLKLGVALWMAARLGQDLRISMETIGVIDRPAAWFTLPPLAATWLLALALLVRSVRDPSSPPAFGWTRLNTVMAAVAAACLVGAALALNLGPQHGPGDLAGLVLIYAGLLAFALSVAPWERRAARSRPG